MTLFQVIRKIRSVILSDFLQLLLVAVTSVCIFSCSRCKPADPLFKWPSSGFPQADSLTVELDRSIATGKESRILKRQMDSLLVIADEHPEVPILRHRHNLFKAYYLFAEGDTAVALKMYETALLALNPDKYPYDLAKWKQFFIQSSPHLYRRYETAFNNYAYFSKTGDEYEKARAAIVLGNTYLSLSDTSMATKYYKESREIASKYKLDNLIWVTSLNLSFSNDSLNNDSILRKMLDLPMVRRSAERTTLVLIRLYENSGNPVWLDRALNLQKNIPANNRKTATLLYLKGERMIQYEKYDSATFLFKAAADAMPPGYTSSDTTLILFRRAEAYEYEEKLDSAVKGLQRAFTGLMNQFEKNRIPDVYLQETRLKVELLRREEQLVAQRRAFLTGMLLLAVLAASAVIIIYYKKKASEKKLKAEIYADKLRHAQEISKLRQVVIDEKNSLISQVEKMVEGGKKNILDSDPLMADLSRTLSIHRGNEHDRKNLVKIKEEEDKEMADRLRKEFPALTKGDIKLIGLLILGLDNHQVARSMNISMESVWKARYRLRTRLQLPADSQLEDFLRDYSKNRP